MSNSQVVIETLTQKRETLIKERDQMYWKFNEQIREIEDALAELTGQAVGKAANIALYDDENPDYIRGTEDGI